MPQRIEQGSLGHVPPVGASPQPYVELGLEHEESEDDPFGHQLLDIGFDEREQGIASGTVVQPETVGGNQATVSGTSNSASAHVSHTLRRTARVVWCPVCGRFAVVRLGKGSFEAMPRRVGGCLHVVPTAAQAATTPDHCTATVTVPACFRSRFS